MYFIRILIETHKFKIILFISVSSFNEDVMLVPITLKMKQVVLKNVLIPRDLWFVFYTKIKALVKVSIMSGFSIWKSRHAPHLYTVVV